MSPEVDGIKISELLTVTAAGCSGKASEPAGVPTGEATPELTEGIEPTKAEEQTETPEPTKAPSSGLAFTPSDTGGRVTFTGNTVEVSEAGIGDMVQFEIYEQDNDTGNGAEAIKWLVLDE